MEETRLLPKQITLSLLRTPGSVPLAAMPLLPPEPLLAIACHSHLYPSVTFG